MNHTNEPFYPPLPPSLKEGTFEYIKDKNYKSMLVTAWKAIHLTETWEYVKKDRQSFTFSDDENIWRIYNKIEELGYTGHSGMSFACIMRDMEFIANHGEEKFKEIQK